MNLVSAAVQQSKTFKTEKRMCVNQYKHLLRGRRGVEGENDTMSRNSELLYSLWAHPTPKDMNQHGCIDSHSSKGIVTDMSRSLTEKNKMIDLATWQTTFR